MSKDRPDVITRVFKQKLDLLMKDFKDEHYFGHLKAGIIITSLLAKKKKLHPLLLII